MRPPIVFRTAIGGAIAWMQGQQEPILHAAINVLGIRDMDSGRNVSKDCWKMTWEWIEG
jgi:hypothetical protein